LFLYALLSCCGLLAVGLALRVRLRVLQVLYIPASVVAGLLGFAVVQTCTRTVTDAQIVRGIAGELSGWPGTLIALVFAGLLLEKPAGGGFVQALRRGARSGILAWIIILGQIVIGLGVYLLVVRPAHPNVHASFGQLLEVSWAGGHGTSGAMASVYANVGFPEGRDLAFFLATFGLIYGVVSGLVLVNLAVRRGWTQAGRAAGPIPIVTGLEPSQNPVPNAFARTRGEVIEPMALQVVILAAAFGVGLGMQRGFVMLAELVLGADDPNTKGQAIDFVQNIPLFLFTLLAGWAVREALHALSLGRLIDSDSIQRLLGVSMEFLIVSAIATMRVESLTMYFVPIALLIVAAAAWSAVCLLVLAPRLLPRAYWFELGLLNYGFSTANTPQGMMLLRIVDPDLKTRAAEDYAVAAPLSAPFIGGGIITFLLPGVLVGLPATVGILILSIGAIVALYFVGRRMAIRAEA
jgi:ESS family glutamate:Na+ symporter